jgi:AcrR family transcriptional regulator
MFVMGTLERRERERQELKIKILDTARELFVAEGYDAVTMRKIAERIEYSPAAIYAHFKDKTSLIRELCETDFRAFAQTFLEFLQVTDPIERLRRAGRAYVDFALENPQHYRLMFMTPRPIIDGEDGEANDPGRNAYAFLRNTVEDAVAQHLLRPELTDTDLVAQTIWAGLHGVVALHITSCRENDHWMSWAPLETRRAQMAEVILRGLLADPTRATAAPPLDRNG